MLVERPAARSEGVLSVMRFGRIRKLPSNRYQASYVGPDGKRHNAPATFTHKTDASAWVAAERRLIEYGTWTSPAARAEAAEAAVRAEAERVAAEERAAEVLASVPTVSEWVASCISERQSRSRRPIKQTTADNYRKLARLNLDGTELGDMRITEVRRTHVHAWRWNGPPSRTRTQGGKAYELLVSVFDDAVVAELIDVTPCTLRGAGAPDRAREPQSLSLVEVARFLESVEEPWARAALTIQVTCGLRIGEVLALRSKDLDLMAETVTVAGTVAKVGGAGGKRTLVIQTPKTRASLRTLSLVHDTVADLRVWRKSRGLLKPEELLFCDALGKPLNDDVLRRIHKKAANEIGRSELKDHDLRATAATLAAAAGASVREIQAMLGHTTPTMALSYQTATRERDAERARKMSAQLANARRNAAANPETPGH
ncbi:MAG: tyrosine-type recombinase/integrase [Tessaracoccus sp.]|uniref:site-specific integrase n=1 Tax=Tessaracoccus sp. TaxID=1971211 RepID=UPI001ED31B7F|nr:tyrosine-type recombinase/integrase [Tessaracoccus sp.]MBK7821506.1 tyrosine-type recombinase/integrase [Tessaracoccus sp.]